MLDKFKQRVWDLLAHPNVCKFCKSPAQFEAEDKHWNKFDICHHCKDKMFIQFEAGGWDITKEYF